MPVVSPGPAAPSRHRARPRAATGPAVGVSTAAATGTATATPPRARRLGLAAAVVVSVVAVAALAGCTAAPAAEPTGPTPTGTPTPSSATAFPLTLDNCGVEVTVDAPPQRVLTVKSTSTELMLALGLGDRVVGQAFPDGPVPDEWAQAAAAIPLVSERVPGQEAVLGLAPDLVYAGWESALTADGVGDRGELAALGIASYVNPPACRGEAYRPDPLTFDDVFAAITEAGDLFGVPGRAADLVAEQRDALTTITPAEGDLTALWYSSGSGTPYVGAGIGAPQLILQTAGLTNLMADVHDSWASVSWEEVVARDPDVIVLVDSSWNTAAHKIEVLESNPATAVLRAVREHRYVTVPFAASEAGVRTVAAAASVAEQVRALP